MFVADIADDGSYIVVRAPPAIAAVVGPGREPRVIPCVERTYALGRDSVLLGTERDLFELDLKTDDRTPLWSSPHELTHITHDGTTIAAANRREVWRRLASGRSELLDVPFEPTALHVDAAGNVAVAFRIPSWARFKTPAPAAS